MNSALPGEVADAEQLARFVMTRRWVRAEGTVRPDAFMPPPDLNLSVTRHGTLSPENLWSRGYQVAQSQGKALLGRADLRAENVRRSLLDVVGFPVPNNPEHAHIVSWPPDKPTQKSLAQSLAAAAAFQAADG